MADLAEGCRFGDCTHTTEPGCEVRDGIDPARLAQYRQLVGEEREASEREAERRKRERGGPKRGRKP